MTGAVSGEHGSRNWQQHVLAVIDGEAVNLERLCSEGGSKLTYLSSKAVKQDITTDIGLKYTTTERG